jgi:hypothetical protein
VLFFHAHTHTHTYTHTHTRSEADSIHNTAALKYIYFYVVMLMYLITSMYSTNMTFIMGKLDKLIRTETNAMFQNTKAEANRLVECIKQCYHSYVEKVIRLLITSYSLK